MEVAGYPILGWLLLFAFCLFCGAGVFHLFYGAVTLFEGESHGDFGDWLLNHRPHFVVPLAIICFVIIAVLAPRPT